MDNECIISKQELTPPVTQANPTKDRKKPMKYTQEERMEIGRQIYHGELTRYEASAQYEISMNTARDYMRLYRDTNHLPSKHGMPKGTLTAPSREEPVTGTDMESYESMSKEELILELVKARIREARLKKGYEVKGDGTVIRYGSKNTK